MKLHRLKILTPIACMLIAAFAAAAPAQAQGQQDPIYLPLLFQQNQTCQPTIDIQPTSGEASEQAIVDGINAERRKAGLPAMSEAAGLERIARFHSNDMVINNYFSHDGLKESWSTRFSWLCEKYSTWGEIIGWNSNGDTAWMIQGWMGSPGHRSAILSKDYSVLGAGYAAGGGRHMWTVDFGKPAPARGPQPAGEPTCETTVTGDAENGSLLTLCSYPNP